MCVFYLAIDTNLRLTISAVAEAEKAGIEKAGGTAEIYQYVSCSL